MSNTNSSSIDGIASTSANADVAAALANDFQLLAVGASSESPAECSAGQFSLPVLSFSLSSTHVSLQSLAGWWNDAAYGPVADAQPQSWLRAFPMLVSVCFGHDGRVTITQRDDSAEAVMQAAGAKKHIEKVTRKLQYLRCDACGNNIASPDKACCELKFSSCLATTFRMSGDVVDSIFSQPWQSASAEDAERWLALHDSSTKDRNGKSILPALFSRTPAAEAVEEQAVRLLNGMDIVSARLVTQGCFRSRPFTLMASSFKSKHADEFLKHVSVSMQSSVSEREPSFCSRFGKVIDKQLKWAVRHGVEDKSLPECWSDAHASFGVLPYAPLQGVHICQETDALCSAHVVRAIDIDLVFDWRAVTPTAQGCALSIFALFALCSIAASRASRSSSRLSRPFHSVPILAAASPIGSASATCASTFDKWPSPKLFCATRARAVSSC